MAEILTDTDWSEHYIKRGDPAKPTYYIIRQKFSVNGLFSWYNFSAGHIRHALSNGWIPVIDMQNYPNPYLSPEKLGKENSWEYYFEQPMKIGLKEAYDGENIILSDGKDKFPRPSMSIGFLEGKVFSFFGRPINFLLEFKSFVNMGILKVKPERMREILTVWKKLFSPNDRVLGVKLRGTDYMALKPKAHPIPPPVEFAANVTKAKLKEWNCNKIFLSTEDKSIVNDFQEWFGDLVVIYDKEFIDCPEGKIPGSIHLDRENDHFTQGKDYLTEIVLLSMCNSLVAARCSGTVSAVLMAKYFEHTYFFDLGIYGKMSYDDDRRFLWNAHN